MIEVPILMYHAIEDNPNGIKRTAGEQAFIISREQFEEQLQFFSEMGYSSISPDDFLQWRTGYQKAPQQPILITFDDGDSTNYTSAYPLLKKYNFKATFFIVTNSIDTSAGMKSEQIIEMAKKGMTIGSHTMTHRLLPELSDNQILFELDESKKILEQLIQQPVINFSLPGGRFSKRVIEIARKVGYKIVMNSVVGMNDNSTNLLALRRFAVKKNYSVKQLQGYFGYKNLFRLKFQLKNSMKNLLFKILGHRRYARIWERLVSRHISIRSFFSK